MVRPKKPRGRSTMKTRKTPKLIAERLDVTEPLPEDLADALVRARGDLQP